MVSAGGRQAPAHRCLNARLMSATETPSVARATPSSAGSGRRDGSCGAGATGSCRAPVRPPARTTRVRRTGPAASLPAPAGRRCSVRRVAAVGVVLQLPERVHVLGDARRLRELDDGQHLVLRIVAAEHPLAATRVDADLAAKLPVCAEVDDVTGGREPLGRHGAEVVGGHLRTKPRLRPGLDRHDHGRGRRRIEHAENPNREQPGLLLPGIPADVRDLVVRLEGDEPDASNRRQPEPLPGHGRRQQAHLADRPPHRRSSPSSSSA